MITKTQALENGSFLTLLALVTILFTVVIGGFLMPMFWAAVLAVLFTPLHRKLCRRFGGRSASAAIVTVVIAVVLVVVPLSLLGIAVGNEAIGLYDRIQEGDVDLQQSLATIEEKLPALSNRLNAVGIDLTQARQSLSEAATTASKYLASRAVSVGQNALRITILFFLMLYLLFFFLKDREKLVSTIIRALPLGRGREAKLFARFALVARATIKGTLIVGTVQGTLGALLFWIVGIPSPVFWGVLMGLMSFIPAIGPAAIWLPAAIIFFFTGEVVRGIAIVLVGVLVIGLVDNLLRPIVVGRDTEIPDYLVLLATLGGLALFGISGFVIGPIIAALFLTLWSMFVDEYGVEEDVDVVKEAVRDQT